MHWSSRKRAFVIAITLLVATKNMATPIGPQLVIQREEAIATCENRFRLVLHNFSRIAALKKPKKKASAHDKAVYVNKYVITRAFLTNMNDLISITNNKAAMRDASSAEQLISLSKAYSSNCSRFALSLNEFIHWALGEELRGNRSEVAAKHRIFQEWIDQAENFAAPLTLPSLDEAGKRD